MREGRSVTAFITRGKVGKGRKCKNGAGFDLSPPHNSDITAWMKAFIDRLYCFYGLVDGRPGDWAITLLIKKL